MHVNLDLSHVDDHIGSLRAYVCYYAHSEIIGTFSSFGKRKKKKKVKAEQKDGQKQKTTRLTGNPYNLNSSASSRRNTKSKEPKRKHKEKYSSFVSRTHASPPSKERNKIKRQAIHSKPQSTFNS